MANKVVKALLERESDILFGIHHNGSGHEPAHQFRHLKHPIDNSKVFEVAKRAPKGALLHCHFDAVVPSSELISTAHGMPNIHIKTDAALTHAESSSMLFSLFKYSQKERLKFYANTDMFAPTYVPRD
jgi:adenosine deaminase CECR1